MFISVIDLYLFMEEEYTTIRLRRDLLFKLVEIRGKIKVKTNDDVIEYLIKKGWKK